MCPPGNFSSPSDAIIEQAFANVKIAMCTILRDYWQNPSNSGMDEEKYYRSIKSEMKYKKFTDIVVNSDNLKSFVFMMNVEDGDLSMCLDIPYVSIKNRKHYSHKDKDFLKLL